MNKKFIIVLLLTISIPALIGSAESAFAAAVRTNPEFTVHVLEDAPGDGTDEGSVMANIGFTVNFFGSMFNDLFVNNNGNITFESAFNDFDPMSIDFSTSPRKIIAPFFADIDTRTLNTPPATEAVTYGRITDLDGTGNPAFGVNWSNVFCFGGNSLDLLNSFQLVLIDRSADFNPGDFDIEFNYDSIVWDTATSAGANVDPNLCVETISEDESAKIGFADGVPDEFFELPGSGVSGAFLNSGPAATSLIQNSLNSLEPGRYIIPVRNGDPITEPMEIIGGEIISINSVSLLLAGIQSMPWMIPVSLSIIGIGIVLIKRR